MHQGSVRIANDHPMFKTYVDDTANVASGSFSQVQSAIVECALAFNKLIVKKKGFVLSPKSAIVATSKKLANNIAKELFQYGISVQVCSSTRDVGVMFTAAKYRDTSLAESRFDRARIRNNRIIRIANVTRSARKLFVSGAYPQASWGHQVVGLAPSKVLAFRRMVAASTGVNPKAQRCLTSCISVCFGKRGDP